MSNTTPEALLLKSIPRPAFFVCEGTVLAANNKAAKLKIKPGTPIDELLRTGSDEYRVFTRGRLCLTLIVDKIAYDASVIKYHDRDLFYVEAEFLNPELFMMAETVKPLKDPLSCAMLSVDILQSDPNVKENPALASLNRHLYRLYKFISDMSDAASYGKMRESKMITCDIPTEMKEIMEKAAELLKEAKRSLRYNCSIADDFYGCIDKEKVERAILCMISEMTALSKEGAPVKVFLSKEKKRMLLRFLCRVPEQEREYIESQFFSCHIVPDGLDVKNGQFNQMIIARNAVSSHFGTLQIDRPRVGSLSFTFSIPVDQNNSANVNSQIMLPTDYAGGYDHHLVAFSDILPDNFYK